MKELKRSQGRFGLLNNSGNRLLLVHGQVSQNLTIDFNIRFLQASDQTAVRQTVCTGASVDTGNPQCAERALTVATVTVGILTSLDNRLLGNAEYTRSEEHTSELQSRENLVCRLLLEKKKTNISKTLSK